MVPKLSRGCSSRPSYEALRDAICHKTGLHGMSGRREASTWAFHWPNQQAVFVVGICWLALDCSALPKFKETSAAA